MMITSASNSKIKYVKQLLASKKQRDTDGLFVAEGEKLFREILRDCPEKISEVLVSESFMESVGDSLKAELDRFSFETVKDSVFNTTAETVTPQGVLCIVKKPSYDLQDVIARQGTVRIIMLERLGDPGNMGTIFRTAEAAGMDLVILSDNCTDVFNPKVVRSTMGSVLRVPFAVVPESLETLKTLKKAQITSYATFLSASEEFDTVSYSDRSVFLIGNESKGLKEETAFACDARIRIPMSGKVESLNAAVAAALIMYRGR
ncbi:MAG: RNA methyltransferase [Lachnospiraceae bacterium]|nr:RNA methyltransferase [Lachnospiraceae bacterium]